MKKMICITIICQFLFGCLSYFEDNQNPEDRVLLPYLKNSANECYFLDDFMPVPDSLVAGKYGRLNLRYYSYRTAKYKDWEQQKIILSFYSQDEKCWALFEESYIAE